jgi:hypothetical protein
VIVNSLPVLEGALYLLAATSYSRHGRKIWMYKVWNGTDID